MKAVNVVLSILILLLAAASAVFSYFLFEKRSQMVEGWKKMATTINQSAKEMDKGSGTKVGDTLTVEALSHENYAELDQKLAQLTTQSRALIKQRDELANALRRIGTMVEMKNVPAEKTMKEMTTYSTAKDDVINGTGDLISNRNKIVERVVSSARANLNINLNAAKLNAADNTELEKYANRLNQYGKERRDFEAALRDIYRQCGNQGALNFSGNNFTGELNKVKQAVSAMKGKLDEANRTIAARNQEIQRQNNQIKQLNGQVASAQKALDEKVYQLESLRDVLGLNKDEKIPMPWKPGSPEARKQVVGRVVDVSTKYGYISINLGTDSTVPQQLGNKVGNINIGMAPGLEMIVSRGELEVPTSEFITKVKITKVDKNCAIAEPFGDQNGEVEVGDKVWFDIQ